MFDRPPRYRSYLLTVWEERSRDPNLPPVWRFSLEDPRTEQRRGFADLAALVAALRDEISGAEVVEWESQKGPTRRRGSGAPDAEA
jgi:hypothetical protein